MTDKELLELAAKAAGYEVRWNDMWKCFVHVNPHYIDYPQTMAGQRNEWVPLDDDGDALRLAVKLRMCIDTGVDDDTSFAGSAMVQNGIPDIIRHNDDPYAATRRAIVRAAAEIGRTT